MTDQLKPDKDSAREDGPRDQVGWYVVHSAEPEYRRAVITGDFTRQAAFDFAKTCGGRVVRVEWNVI